MRPIDADALKMEILNLLNRFDTTECDLNNCYPYWIFSKTLQEAPTLDYAPVRRGRWFVIQTPFEIISALKCSECGWAYEPLIMTYCPNCGALMCGKEDGKDEDND